MMIIFLIVIVVVIVIVNRRTAMKIDVFCTDDRTMHTLTVSKTSTVLDVKTAVMAAGCCIPIASQQLRLGRRIMLDDDPLSLYNIKPGTVLWLERIPAPPALPAPLVQMAPALPAPLVQMAPALPAPLVQMAPALPAPLVHMAPAPTTNPAEDADINTQINYIKKLLQKGRRFLIVPLDEDDDDDDK
jgi:hypothetical protein